MKPTIIERPTKVFLALTLIGLGYTAALSLLQSLLWIFGLGFTIAFLISTLYIHKYFLDRSISKVPPPPPQPIDKPL